MNKRIEELAEQCSDEQLIEYDDGGMYVEVFDKEKFAELIVAECMTTILKESKWYWDKDEFESSNAIQNAARRLKEHFGVEEQQDEIDWCPTCGIENPTTSCGLPNCGLITGSQE